MKKEIFDKLSSAIPCGRSANERPINFTGALSDFKYGVLCQVIAVRYQGKGPVKLILHEATIIEDDGPGSYGYGIGRHWTVSPASLMGASTSEKKATASRRNGKLGGAPKRKLK